MKQSNFVKLMELRDTLLKEKAPFTTESLKVSINESLNKAIEYLNEKITTDTTYLDEGEMANKFVKWFCKQTENDELEFYRSDAHDKLLEDVFGRSWFRNRSGHVVDSQRINNGLKRYKGALMSRLSEYFEQDMVTPEDYAETRLSDNDIKKVCNILLEVIADEAGWRSGDKNNNDELPNPAVESLIADIGKLVSRSQHL